MKFCFLTIFLFFVGCASYEPMPVDNFVSADLKGVRIIYPYGGGSDHVSGSTFYYSVAGSKIMIKEQRLYVNGKLARSLKEGDRIFIEGPTVLLNGAQIVPEI